MDRCVAVEVIAHTAEASSALAAAIAAMRTSVARAGVDEAERRVAMLVHLIGSGLLHPIYYEHPDLCPEDLRFMTTRPPGPDDWL